MGRAQDTKVGRLGLVLYWAGIGIATLFIMIGGWILFYFPTSDRIVFFGIAMFFTIVSFFIGRAALFILGGE